MVRLVSNISSLTRWARVWMIYKLGPTIVKVRTTRVNKKEIQGSMLDIP